jgi:hypothetical protein
LAIDAGTPQAAKHRASPRNSRRDVGAGFDVDNVAEGSCCGMGVLNSTRNGAAGFEYLL